ncbi:MAG TPA: tetratricopeptide repeat protein [Drouetiella sp.]
MNADPIVIIVGVVSVIALIFSVIVFRMLSGIKTQYQDEIDNLKAKLQRAEAEKENTRRAITGEFKQLLSDQRAITATGTNEQFEGVMKTLDTKMLQFETQTSKRLSDLESRQANMPNPSSLARDLKSSLQEDIERLQLRQSAIQENLKKLEQQSSDFSKIQATFVNLIDEKAAQAAGKTTAESKASMDALAVLMQQLQEFVKSESEKTKVEINELIAKNDISVKSSTLDKFLMLMDSDEERKAAALSFVRQIASEDLFAELAIQFPSTIAVAALEQMAKKSDKKDVFVAALGNLATQKLEADMYDDARALYMQAIDMVQDTSTEPEPKLLWIYAKLAQLCLLQTDFDYAKVVFKRVIDAQKTATPEQRLFAVQALSDLSKLYEGSNFTNRLEELYKRLHENYVATGQLDKIEAARNLRKLADLYLAEERYEEAEPAYHRALPTYSKSAEAEDPELIALLRSLAKAYFHLNQLDKSESLQTQLIDGLVKARATDEVLIAVKQLEETAEALEERNSFHRAESIYEKCANALKEVLPSTDERLSSIYEKLENLAKRAEDKEHLKKFYRDQMTTQKNGNAKSAKYINSALKLSTLYAADGNFEEAESLYKSLENAKSYDKESAELLDELAKACSSQAKYDLAQKTYEKSLALKEKMLGASSPELIDSFANLGASYSVQKEYKLAEDMFKRELTLTEKNFGVDNERTITALMHLAGCYIISGKIEEAEPCYKRILETRYKALGAEHPDIIVSLLHLAELYRIQKDYGEAEIFYESAAEMAEKIHGADSLKMAEILEKQASLAKQDDQPDKAIEFTNKATEIRRQLDKEQSTLAGVAGPDTATAEI